MQIISDVQRRVQEFAADNSTTILTAGGVVGTVVTGVLAFRAGYTTGSNVTAEEIERIADQRGKTFSDEPTDTFGMSTKDKVKIAAPHVIPPVLTGGATIAAIVFSHRMSAQKAAALAAAYGLSQKQLEEYRAKVTEKLGLTKEQKIKDELAQDRVDKAPGSSQVIIIGDDVLCFDQPTGRYFRSSMEKINRAVNAINAEIVAHDMASATQFYDELELPGTTWTNEVGWNSGNYCDLDITTTTDENGRPCLSIDFKNYPTADFKRRMWD